MKKTLSIVIFLVLLFSPSAAQVKPDSDDFHQTVIKHYSFSPSRLNKEEIEKKSRELDSFWHKVSSNRDNELPKLREELRRPDNPVFFYYNGGKLLLSLSNENSDRQLAVAAIARCDLVDVQPIDYVQTIMKLGMEGIDTSIAAFRILKHPSFKMLVPAHSMTLNQSYSLVLMLYQLPEDMFQHKAISLLEQEKNADAKKALLLVLWYAVTPLADAAILSVAHNEAELPQVRDFARKLTDSSKHVSILPYSKIAEFRNQIAFSQSMRKIAPLMPTKTDVKNLSKDNVEGFKLMLQALWDTGEQRGRDIVRQFMDHPDDSMPKEIYEDIKKAVLEHINRAPNTASKEDDIGQLRVQRRSILSGISDEVLHDFEAISALIRWNESKKSAEKKNEK